MKVKLAASMPVSRSAARQRSELLANATIASTVRRKTRGFRRQTSNAQRPTSNAEFKSKRQRSTVRRARTLRREVVSFLRIDLGKPATRFW